MYLLGIDLETTGLDPEHDEIIEFGYVMWCTHEKKPITMGGFLIKPAIPISKEIEDITGITNNSLRIASTYKEHIERVIEPIAFSCKHIVGHNGIAFDKKFLEADPIFKTIDPLFSRNWIDTKIHVNYPKHIKTRKLTHLAADHGIHIGHAHRAMFDALGMMLILSKYDIIETIERSKSSLFELTARVTYDERKKAKDAGFHFRPTTKSWVKVVLECDIEGIVNEKLDFEFSIKKLNDYSYEDLSRR